MKLDIIIPNHDGEETIEKTIKSIYSSKGINKFNFKIYLIDDASTDNSVKIVKKNFPTVKVIPLYKNSGAAKARNIGIIKSEGDHILFIDSDVWLNKSALKNLTEKTDADILYPKITYENGTTLYPVFDEEKKYCYVSGCFLIKRDSLDRLDSYFDENYKTYLEDYDFFIRCNEKGITAKYVESSRAVHKNKEGGEYLDRYILEVKNLIYGRRKLGKKSPFIYSNIGKAFICGLFNFAWFNWYGYDRTLNKFDKFKLLFRHKNKITEKNIFIRMSNFFYGLFQGFSGNRRYHKFDYRNKRKDL